MYYTQAGLKLTFKIGHGMWLTDESVGSSSDLWNTEASLWNAAAFTWN